MVMDNRGWPGPSRPRTPSIIDTPWRHTNHQASSLVEDGASLLQRVWEPGPEALPVGMGTICAQVQMELKGRR